MLSGSLAGAVQAETPEPASQAIGKPEQSDREVTHA
jgi:hypothetical protein